MSASQKTDSSAFVAFANSVFTTGDMYRLFDQLEELKRFLFKDKAGTISQKAGFYMPKNLAPTFLEIESLGLEPAEDLTQQRFLDSVIAYLRSLPLVKMTLAFEPTDSFVKKINGEVSDLIHQKALLDITVDQHVMGGAIVEYRGRRKEYVLSQALSASVEKLTRALLEKKAP